MPTEGDIRPLASSDLYWDTNALLGQGSFGMVFSGKLYGTPVAVKVIKPPRTEPYSEEHEAAEHAAIKQHHREVQRLQVHRNPFIIQYLNVFHGPNPKDLYIVTEYMEGGSLYDGLVKMRARSAILESYSFLQVAKHMAYGLCHVHSQNYTHGDLKPQNVLLTAGFTFSKTIDGHVFASFPPSAKAKIADFGLSKRLEGADPVTLLESTTATIEFGNGPCGTYLYMSPEAYKGVANLTDHQAKAADVYAYGLILFELLSGLQSWSVEGVRTPVQLQSLVRDGCRPKGGERWELVDAQYVRLVTQCWDEDVNKRPTFNEIIKRLESFEKEWEQSKIRKSFIDLPPEISGLNASVASGKEDLAGEGMPDQGKDDPFHEHPSPPCSDTSPNASFSPKESFMGLAEGSTIRRVSTMRPLTDSQTAKCTENTPLDHFSPADWAILDNMRGASSHEATSAPVLSLFENAPNALVGDVNAAHFHEEGVNTERPGEIDDSVLEGIRVRRVKSETINPPANPPLHIEQNRVEYGAVDEAFFTRSRDLTSSQTAKHNSNLLQSMIQAEGYLGPLPSCQQTGCEIVSRSKDIPNACSLANHESNRDSLQQGPVIQAQQPRASQNYQGDLSGSYRHVTAFEPRIPEAIPPRPEMPPIEMRAPLQPTTMGPQLVPATPSARPFLTSEETPHFQLMRRSAAAASLANNSMPGSEQSSSSAYLRHLQRIDPVQGVPQTPRATYLDRGTPFTLPSHLVNTTSPSPLHWPRGDSHRAFDSVNVPSLLISSSDPRNMEIPDLNTVLMLLRRFDLQSIDSLWSHGHKKMVAAGLAQANFLAGKEMLIFASRYLDQSSRLTQGNLEPLIVRDLCVCIGNIAQNQCELLGQNVVLSVISVTISTMNNLFNLLRQNINDSLPIVFSACNFALCNLIRVHNKVQDPRLRSEIAKWISFSISSNGHVRSGRGLYSESLSYTAISAARSFIWRNEENLMELQKNHLSGMGTSGILLKLFTQFDWFDSVLVVEASLSALAVLIVLQAEQQEFMNYQGVKELLRVLRRRATNRKIVKLVFAMLAMLMSGPVVKQVSEESVLEAFQDNNGYQNIVHAMNQVLRASPPKEELVSVLEAGCSAMLMTARFCDRLREQIVVYDTLRVIDSVAQWLFEYYADWSKIRRGTQERLCITTCQLIQEASKIPSGAQYFSSHGMVNTLKGLSAKYANDEHVSSICRATQTAFS